LRKLVSMREALSDPAYFGSVLAGPTWDAWRVLLIAIMGEPLKVEELATFALLTGRTASPAEPVEAFWAVIGRRGGKTRAIAVLASYLAGCVDHRDILGPGERGILPVMAASVLQASQAFNFIHGAIEGSSHLSRLIESVTADTISLASGVNIQVRPASFRTIRGISAVGAICDEIAFFRSDDAKNPDEEIIRALRPSLATTGGPLICISSPYAKAGMLWKTFRKQYGLHGASEILVAKAASRQMNPSLSARVVERAFEEDAAGDKWGSEFVRERFRDCGITLEPSERTKSDLYLELLPILSSGRIRLIDNKRLLAQLIGLERRTARSGRDSVDHGPGLHDDIANACAGAVLAASGRRGAWIVSDELLAYASRPRPWSSSMRHW
jgi:hypothetical protein